MIKMLILSDFDIFEYAEHQKWTISFPFTFQDDVRKLLLKNKTAKWDKNPIIQDIINKKYEDSMNVPYEYSLLLNEAVRNQDIPKIKILIALGSIIDYKDDGDTCLYYCAVNGLTEIARILLNNFADPNYLNKKSHNTFCAAVINEHFDMANLLLDYGAEIDLKNKNGNTLLHVVYKQNKRNLIYYLLNIGANPNIKGKQGKTVTFLAFLNNDDEVTDYLLDNGKGNINTQDSNKNSLAHIALLRGDLKRIDFLSKRKIDMNLRNKQGQTVLMLAFLNGCELSVLDFLIKRGCNINTVDNNNNNLLHHFFNLKNPSKEMFDFLISNNIDINVENDNKQFPISIAIKNCHDNLGLILLNKNCCIIDSKSIHEPIVEALERNSSKWFEALVNHGADALNKKYGVISKYIDSEFYKYYIFKKIPKMNIFIGAPFQFAIYNNLDNCATDIWNLARTKELKEKLSKNLDCYKRCPLSAALKYGNKKFVDILINKSYDCTSQDNEGRTPFIYACINGNIDWIIKLLEILPIFRFGVVDNYGCSAVTYAANNKNEELCVLLFKNNIVVQKIKLDKNGIIQKLRNLENRYYKALKNSEINLNLAKNKYQKCLNERDNLSRRIDDYNTRLRHRNEEADDLESKGNYDNSDVKRLNNLYYQLMNEKEKIEKELNQVVVKYNKTLNVYKHYNERDIELCNMTREDVYNKISYIESLGVRDIEI